MKVDGKKQEMARGRKMEGWPRSGELQPIGQRKQERGRRSCQLAVQLAETRTGPAQLRRGLGRIAAAYRPTGHVSSISCATSLPDNLLLRVDSSRLEWRFDSKAWFVGREPSQVSNKLRVARRLDESSSGASMSATEANEKQRLHY